VGRTAPGSGDRLFNVRVLTDEDTKRQFVARCIDEGKTQEAALGDYMRRCVAARRLLT